MGGGIAVIAIALAAIAGVDEVYEPPDCAVNSLYLMLRLSGSSVELKELTRRLPASRPEGYSMSDLQAAARGSGVELRGVRLDAAQIPLDRPAIAFMKKPGAGHFVVLNPAGSTGTMVQVLEPPFAPQLVDYKPLLSGRAWTGKLLVAESTRERLAPIARLMGSALAVVSVAYWAFRVRRWWRPVAAVQ